MAWMKQQLVQQSKSSSSRQDAKGSLWIFRLAYELNSVWLIEGRKKMRKVATTILILILSGLGASAATAAAATADQPRTMDDVIDRLITNENRANQNFKQYTPLWQTHFHTLSPHKN